MNNNPFDMGFREYFYYRPCCKCEKYYDCDKCNGFISNATAMILKRLERIMVEDITDCWEGENDD